MSFSQFMFGRPGGMERHSALDPQQTSLRQQMTGAAMGPGAGGAFGESADYYRSLLSQDPNVMQQFMQPEMRRFRQETMPSLAQQYAGMGIGAQGGGGFQRRASMAGADLGERLGQIRAGLGMQGAQGLMGLGQQAAQPYQQLAYRPRSPGFLEQAAPGIGKAIGMGIGNPLGQGISSILGLTGPQGG